MGQGTNDIQRLFNRYKRERHALWKSLKAGLITKGVYFRGLRVLDYRYSQKLRELEKKAP